MSSAAADPMHISPASKEAKVVNGRHVEVNILHCGINPEHFQNIHQLDTIMYYIVRNNHLPFFLKILLEAMVHIF